MSIQIAALCLVCWTLGALYGGYKMERQKRNRALSQLVREALSDRGEK